MAGQGLTSWARNVGRSFFGWLRGLGGKRETSVVPSWFVLKDETRHDVAFDEDLQEVICNTWDQWLQMAGVLEVQMADCNFDWCNFAKRASENSMAHVVTVRSKDSGDMGFLYYLDPFNGKPLNVLFMSVRPDCRDCHPRRTITGVGKVTLAYACRESCDKNPGKDLDLGAVLPEAKDFFRKYGAEYVTTDGQGDDLYVIRHADCLSLVELYA